MEEKVLVEKVGDEVVIKEVTVRDWIEGKSGEGDDCSGSGKVGEGRRSGGGDGG